jgi:serine/threonine protein kinase
MQGTLKAVKKGVFRFPAAQWHNRSSLAKDLIVRLLVLDPNNRLSAEQALHHHWIAQGYANPPTTHANESRSFVPSPASTPVVSPAVTPLSTSPPVIAMLASENREAPPVHAQQPETHTVFVTPVVSLPQ